MIKKAFLLTLLLGCITCLVQAAEKVEYSGLWFELNNDKTAATLIATQDENPYTGNPGSSHNGHESRYVEQSTLLCP